MTDDDLADEAQRLYESWDDETRKFFWARLLQDDNPPFRTVMRITNRYPVNYEDWDAGYRPDMPPGPPQERWIRHPPYDGLTARWDRVVRDWWGSTRLAGSGRTTIGSSKL
jgi:hypothetical protein